MHMSDDDKLRFFQDNLTKNRFRMVLLFLSGLTKLEFPDVSSVLSKESWKKDRVHICHLTYEARNHCICKDIAVRCCSSSDESSIELTGSKFDKLVVSDFVANSDCQWTELKLEPNDISVAHRAFSTNSDSVTCIDSVSVTFSCKQGHVDVAPIGLFESLPQISEVCIVVDFTGKATAPEKRADEAFVESMSKYFTQTKVIHNKLYFITLYSKFKDTKHYSQHSQQLCKALGQCLIQSSCITEIVLKGVLSKAVQYIFTALSQEVSNSSLESLVCTCASEYKSYMYLKKHMPYIMYLSRSSAPL